VVMTTFKDCKCVSIANICSSIANILTVTGRRLRRMPLSSRIANQSQIDSCAFWPAGRVVKAIHTAPVTRMVQVLDVSVNKPLKDLIKEEYDSHYD
jgi:hypothetical protein